MSWRYVVLIVISFLVGWLMPRSDPSYDLRIHEAKQIVRIYELKACGLEIKLRRAEVARDYEQEKLSRLHEVSDGVSQRMVLETKLALETANLEVLHCQNELEVMRQQVELSKIRLKAAIIDPDDFTIYVE